MPQIDIITGEKRVRQWTRDEKLSILEAAFAPGVVVKDVARRANISTGQLYTWRKQLMGKKTSGSNGFARVVMETAVSSPKLSPPLPVEPAPATALSVQALPVSACDLPAIEVEVRGNKVRIPPTMPASLASAVVRALVRR